jgi:glucosamine--fructose-6-phosphate aminotransferase (isomerizing)
MCGIVGYVGNEKASPILLRNLKMLEYRGYDSCGIATLDDNLHLKKDVGNIDEVNSSLNFFDLPGNAGIAHTRWATHGNVTKNNAHPHLDCKGKIAIVHNGIISNYEELKAELLKRGHVFHSETDSECLAHLIEDAYDGSLERATAEALKKIRGTYALLVLSPLNPTKLICARNESPLMLGLSDEGIFVGSDVASFLGYTKKAVALDDGEYAVIDKKGYTIKEIGNAKRVQKDVLDIDWSVEMAEKEGNPHFMLKEILEQPNVITNALNIYPDVIKGLAEMISGAKAVYILAAGTSLHAGMVAEYWFAQLCNKRVNAMDSSEFINKGVVDEDTLVIGITQSGETYDTLAAMRYAKRRGARVAAVVNVLGSTATRLADHVVLQGSGIEISVCATKTFTSQLTVLLRTVIELGKMMGKNVQKVEEELLNCPSYVKGTLAKRDSIKEVADEYFNANNYIFIGKGINLPSALEGALKFKEITYEHAEGMSGGLLKHGTISLIDKGLNTVAMVPEKGDNRTRIINNIREVKARGGVVVGIASGREVEQCDVSIVAPACHELVSPIVLAPIYQLLAYYAAVNRGRNVDKPRALAKSVTVE